MTHPQRSFCCNTTIVYIYNTVIYTNYKYLTTGTISGHCDANNNPKHLFSEGLPNSTYTRNYSI